MHQPLTAYWVTVRHDATHTQDHRVIAPTAWSAGWLWRQLNPSETGEVVMVRPAR